MLGNAESFIHLLYTIKLSHNKVSMLKRNQTQATRIRRPMSTSLRPDKCAADGERMCEDGSCIARVELCPEEQLMNQNTILIMIVVGLAVVVFLVILYCFQQRQRRADRRLGATSGYSDECDNESLYAPPPAYEEVINSNAFPPTPEQRRLRTLPSDEPTSPLTPPPNYASALIILAQSQESISSKQQSNLIRRSLSVDQVYNTSNSETSCDRPVISNKSRRSICRQNIFRFSRQFVKNSAKNNTLHVPDSSLSCQVSPPPPYPDSPLLIPDYPPPPPTPLPSDIQSASLQDGVRFQVPILISSQQQSNAENEPSS